MMESAESDPTVTKQAAEENPEMGRVCVRVTVLLGR